MSERGETTRLQDIIHHYFGVNLDIVWHITHDELPDVAIAIEAVLRDDQDVV